MLDSCLAQLRPAPSVAAAGLADPARLEPSPAHKPGWRVAGAALRPPQRRWGTGGDEVKMDPGRLRSLPLTRVAPYAATALATLGVALWFYQPWSMTGSDVFFGGEDIIALQANVAAAGQVGPFGADPHLAWPTGYDLWSFPQLGLGILTAAWVLTGPLGVGSGAAALIIMIGALVSTSVASLFFIRSVIGRRLPFLAAVLAAAIGLSPFFMGKVGHLNVAVFFLVPITLGAVIRLRGRGVRAACAAAAALAVASAVSPLWWVVVVCLVLGVVAVGTALRRSWSRLLGVGIVLAGVGAGFVFQTLLFWRARVDGAPLGRGVWGSNEWGGRLSDLTISSPFLNQFYPDEMYGSLVEGSSQEQKPLGLVAATAALAVALVLLKGMPRRVALPDGGSIRTGMLALVSTVVLLFFLAGGLGNAQAAFAVGLGGASPARVWSRMTIVLAVAGMAWCLVYFARWARDTRRGTGTVKVASLGIGIVVSVVMVLELTSTEPPRAIQSASLSEYPAVEFLRSRTEPCPIAQIPQDGAPVVRVPRGPKTPESLFYYRGYYSYLLAPEYFWSIGSWVPDKPTVMNSIGATLDADGMTRLRSAGACAVMYDKLLARVSRKKRLGLEGSKVSGLPQPDFTSDRYDVYLLAGGGSTAS
ncbi:MAG: hypothetical protein U0990_02110 [Candidatus Nanopelagicales bacterium]|nr:hypothetical protein [Candidatus Nanopelagicales bacterium]